MNAFLTAAGRVILGLYFLVPGAMKFIAWDMHVGLMQHHGLPFIPVLLALAGAVEVVLGLALIVNRFTGVSALVLAALVIAINLTLHDFWNFEGVERAHELQNFIKNTGIFGGLLTLAGFSLRRA